MKNTSRKALACYNVQTMHERTINGIIVRFEGDPEQAAVHAVELLVRFGTPQEAEELSEQPPRCEELRLAASGG